MKYQGYLTMFKRQILTNETIKVMKYHVQNSRNSGINCKALSIVWQPDETLKTKHRELGVVDNNIQAIR